MCGVLVICSDFVHKENMVIFDMGQFNETSMKQILNEWKSLEYCINMTFMGKFQQVCNLYQKLGKNRLSVKLKFWSGKHGAEHCVLSYLHHNTQNLQQGSRSRWNGSRKKTTSYVVRRQSNVFCRGSKNSNSHQKEVPRCQEFCGCHEVPGCQEF